MQAVFRKAPDAKIERPDDCGRVELNERGRRGVGVRSIQTHGIRSQMMKAALFATAVCLLGTGVVAAPPRTLTWKFEGYSQLPAAAAEAQRTRKRLLVGLSGAGS